MNFRQFYAVLSLLFASEIRADVVTIVTQPATLDVGPGDAAGFVVRATGTPPLSYQWYRNGTAVSGATNDLIYFTSAQPADAGDYTVTVSNPEGTISSQSARLTVEAYPTDIVDRSFCVTDSQVNNLTAVAALPDGSILVGCNYTYRTGGPYSLVRLRGDGSVDPSFAPPSAIGAAGAIDSLQVQPDGRVLVSGRLGEAYPGEAFHIRLNADGSFDSNYNPTMLVTDDSATLFPEFSVTDSQGRIYVANQGQILRYSSAGLRDASYSIIVPGTVSQIACMPDNRLLLASRVARGFGMPGPSILAGIYTLQRYTVTGEIDLSFKSFTYTSTGPASGGGYASFTYLPDGWVMVAGDFSAVGDYARNQVVRLNADGSLDLTFSPLEGPDNYPYQSLSHIVPLGDGVHALHWGRFSHWQNFATNNIARIRLDAGRAPLPPRILRIVSNDTALPAGADWNLTIYAAGQGPLTLAKASGLIFGGSIWPDVTLANIQAYILDNRASGAQQVSFILKGPGGASAASAVPFEVIPSAPRIIGAPESITTRVGATAVFSVAARGSDLLEYTWFKDGVVITDALPSPALRIENLTVGNLGSYSVRVTNPYGAVDSPAASLALGPSSWLAAISARARTEPGERTLILGFVLHGGSTKRLLLRGVGPELGNRGVAQPLSDPRIDLYDPTGRIVWSQDDNAVISPFLQPISDWFAIAGANSVAYPGKSAQTFADLSPGTYTLQLSGNNGAAGLALAEVFEADRTTDRITVFSARAYVGVGESIAIPGFVIRGDAPLRVLIRGIGPALARFGVGDTLADPTLRLVDSSGRVIASNDNWQDQPSASEVANTAANAGAFSLADGSHDAAVLLTLNPGAYTALVSGTGNSTGVALMEIYEVR